MGSEGEHGSVAYLAGARAVLPLALATGVMGISFGILAYTSGWGMVAPIVFSVVAFSGTAQFAVVSVLGGGGGMVAAIVAAVLLNARFLPMGIAVAPFLKGGSLRRALEGQAVVDASWAMASRGGGRFDREFMIGATIPQLTLWIVGTIVGVLVGGAVVYEHNNFVGRSQALDAGRYDVSALTIGNDVISSVRVPVGWRVTLYEHAGFTGASRVLTADAPAWAAPLFGFELLVDPAPRRPAPFAPLPTTPSSERVIST